MFKELDLLDMCKESNSLQVKKMNHSVMCQFCIISSLMPFLRLYTIFRLHFIHVCNLFFQILLHYLRWAMGLEVSEGDLTDPDSLYNFQKVQCRIYYTTTFVLCLCMRYCLFQLSI